jgi:hypothetical protein
MRKSSYFDPAAQPCAACGGSGAHPDGRKDCCPVCRGFGNAAPDPNAPKAPAGTICASCGNKARPGDPVLAPPGKPIHYSHAVDLTRNYRDALARLGVKVSR